ncbi:UvrD-helicase domain-containing protein [Actinocorallia lasiicapitis]
MPARLRMLDRADKEILKLPRDVKGAIYDFQHKFRRDPANPSLHFKALKGERLHSARVNADYRALLLHAGGSDYILVAVKHRKEVYENLDRFRPQINPVTGGIEFLDLVAAEERVERTAEKAAVERPPVGLFAHVTAEQLVELGVSEPLIPLIFKLAAEDELLALVEIAPQLTGDVLLALFDGRTAEEILEQITAPVAADEEIDEDDYASALTRPATAVTTDDVALQSVLEDGDFGRWRIFLHPTQRKIVERAYSGPARVSGGPGTGKTIVALHRVRQLVEQLPPGDGKDVLLTTFNKNLAADLRQRLTDLAGPGVLKRVEIVNIDRLATQIVAESAGGDRRQWIDDQRAIREWEDMLTEQGDGRWDPEFLHAEWSQVVLGHAVATRADYFRARRPGRGRAITRQDRAEIWQLVERFVKRLDDKGLWTYRQVAERAARLEAERARALADYEAGQVSSYKIHRESGIWLRPRFRHAVIDEAQDLSAAHWKLLRAMIPHGPADLFIAGDSHQRIYANQVSLGSLGIEIRGRSSRLALSYRTTHEILGAAVGVLGGADFDDLDDGSDDLAGYRSVLRGADPELHGYRTWDAELDGIVERVRGWNDITPASIGICVPERHMVAEVENRLGRAGIVAAAIGSDGPKVRDAVHVGTMHRFKGLEYQRMIIAGAGEGLVPAQRIEQWADTDPVRYRREERMARSLLFVAVTRARDTVAITWHGEKSRFLP